ncbi:hypothetical protein B0T26DRAFT_753242 [Lasiosphaeria miniovina]|uniref:Letm1 RBD domain-containing protein n=1 Tax=Lasiosphaeria miniovina TaxID=1954250 RepID=A0AA40DTS1_9PEZI|nr:uncharacterized protein B0T26DRAFT_753242 [Lasiosphaeria miniovina]KAK0713091.1 hypothetical protein B0T26DRAFT_753242 [Lasiosphaeria miniovina]
MVHTSSSSAIGRGFPLSVLRAWRLSSARYYSSPSSPSSPSSSSSVAATASPKQQQEIAVPLNISPDAANPPASTRPPPLDVPVRAPETSTFSHLFSVGKAYLTFYKTGLGQIFTNMQLVRALPAATTTRSHLLLRERFQHDIRRLPLFGLLMFVCGEFTPLVVLAVPSTVPYTCRIPAHASKLQRRLEAQRDAARRKLLVDYDNVNATIITARIMADVVARSLGLVSPYWERIGGAPGPLAELRVRKRLHRLAEDDDLLVQAGGAPALEPEEVRLAANDRGVNVTGRTDDELRGLLEQWLRVTTVTDNVEERERRMLILLSRSTENWPWEEELKV